MPSPLARASTLFPYTTLFRSLTRQALQKDPEDPELAIELASRLIDAGQRARGPGVHGVAQVLFRLLVLAGVDQPRGQLRSEEHTSELQSQSNLVCRLLLEKKK